MMGFNLHGGDLHVGERIEVQNNNQNHNQMMKHINGDDDEEREIWLQSNHNGFLVDVTDVSSLIFNDLHPLPDLPCMFSISSSLSTPAPVKLMGCASSSSSGSLTSSDASWDLLKSDIEEEHNHSYHPQMLTNSTPYGQLSQSDHMDIGEGEAIVHGEGGGGGAALSSTASMEVPYQFTDDHLGMNGGGCMDVMETFGHMDLIDNNDFFFDPSTILSETPPPPPLYDFDNQRANKNHTQPLLEIDTLFDHQEIITGEYGGGGGGSSGGNTIHTQPQPEIETLLHHQEIITGEDGGGGSGSGGGGGGGGGSGGGGFMGIYSSPDDNLPMVFLEWLRDNKETVCAEDLRNIKLKTATIESAAKKLGGQKGAMKKLLNLVLEWVKTNQLEKKRLKDNTNNFSNNYQQSYPNPNPNPNCTTFQPQFQPNPCYSKPQWIPNPAYNPAFNSDPFSGLVQQGYTGGSFGNGPTYNNTQPPLPNQVMLDSSPAWSANPFNDQYNCMKQGQGFNGYGSTQYSYPGTGANNTYVGDPKLGRLSSSATKEARRNRMAKQKRVLSHHRNHQQQNQTSGGGGGVEPGLIPKPSVLDEIQQRQFSADRRQVWNPEMNLRFLLQKILKQSDVGNFGRIVLPKREAEMHLPGLQASDGICIPMEDIGTSRVWNMRYRFWPNNKSRMYILENTGEFLKTNKLQAGDFIVIYSDLRTGKYLIRGVKVKERESKSENNKRERGKSQRNNHLQSIFPSSSTQHAAVASSPNNMIKNTSTTK